MPKVRLYHNNKIILDQHINLSSSQKHYLQNVMRMKKGQDILIFDDNKEYLAKVVNENCFTVSPKKFVRENRNNLDIWLFFSIVKKKQIEYMVEKVTEIGVNKIIPLQTDHSELNQLKNQRLEKIIIESTEQSGLFQPPQLENCTNLNQTFSNWDKQRTIFICDEKLTQEKSMTLNKKKKKVAIFIGPIGGWSEQERKFFQKVKCFRISLGNSILKADTAAIYALSRIRTLFL
tara:strand:- start:78 stop:776 length:699 start_codon:yes stop_codon:yes gene_type:complete